MNLWANSLRDTPSEFIVRIAINCNQLRHVRRIGTTQNPDHPPSLHEKSNSFKALSSRQASARSSACNAAVDWMWMLPHPAVWEALV
jgi:hypothetical protein